MRMATLGSWADDKRFRYYSGTATYTKRVDVPESFLRGGAPVFLDFGKGTRVPPPDRPAQFNMRAYLEGPVREAAVVYIGDKLAGYLWHPPFRVDVRRLLKPGINRICVVVGNTAINELAGTALPNYRLLYSKYGVEFIPQGVQDLKPLPPRYVNDGPIFENVIDGDAVDVLRFPVPRHHEADNALFIGTVDCVVTEEPHSPLQIMRAYRSQVRALVPGLY